MRRELFEVIEAARAMQVQLAPTQANSRCVRIGGDRSEFPGRLWRLGRALEDFDAAGAPGMAGGAEGLGGEDINPAMDAARLRVALDGVFRWMRSTGMDVGEPYAVVSEALGVASPTKQAKAYRPVPRFAPNGFRKPVKVKPLLNLDPVLGEVVSLEGLARKEFAAQATEVSMGAAAPGRGNKKPG